MVRASVADYYRFTLTGIQNQVARLGGSLFEAELIAYIARNGPTSGFAPESGDATNPFRPKAWHLGRMEGSGTRQPQIGPVECRPG